MFENPFAEEFGGWFNKMFDTTFGTSKPASENIQKPTINNSTEQQAPKNSVEEPPIP